MTIKEFKNVKCPDCKNEFDLYWNNENFEKCTLIISLCQSGVVTDVLCRCPFCFYCEKIPEIKLGVIL